MTENIETQAVNTTLDNLTTSYDVASYSRNDLFKIIDMDILSTTADIRAKITEMIDDYANNADNVMIQFLDDIETALLDVSGDEPEDGDGVLFDATDHEDMKAGYNEIIVNSKQKYDPINPKTVQKIISVDTRFRNNYYTSSSSDFTVVLPYKIPNVISMRLASYEIPATFYSISKDLKNNTFQITNIELVRYVLDIDGNIQQEGVHSNGLNKMRTTVTIPDGNYFSWYLDRYPGIRLQDAINQAIKIGLNQTMFDYKLGLYNTYKKAVGESVTDADIDNTNLLARGEDNRLIEPVYEQSVLSVTYACNELTGKSSFSSYMHKKAAFNAISSFTVSFAGDDTSMELGNSGIELPATLGWLLGFRLPEYNSLMTDYSSTNLGLKIAVGESEPTIISEGMCDLRGPRYAYIGVEDFNNNSHEHYIGAFSSGTMKSDVLTRISTSTFENVLDAGMNTGDNSSVSSTVNATRKYYGPVDIQQLKISLYDDFGRILYLNEMDWSFTLALDQIHDVGKLT